MAFDNTRHQTLDGIQKCNEAIEVMAAKPKVNQLIWSPLLAQIASKMAPVVDYVTVDKRDQRKCKLHT